MMEYIEFSDNWIPYEMVKIIDLKPFEFYDGSIVTQGFILDKIWKPAYIIFETECNLRKVKVTNALITPTIAVLYIDKDIRNWPYNKICKLYCDREIF